MLANFSDDVYIITVDHCKGAGVLEVRFACRPAFASMRFLLDLLWTLKKDGHI